MEPAGTVVGSGHTLKRRRVAEGERKARSVSELWHRGGPSWQLYRVKETEKGPVVWEVRETRFFPSRDGIPGQELRLLIARHVLTGELKYFLAHAPREVTTEQIRCVAFSRWHIERLFEDSKGEVGLDHFEVRKYRSLRRHLVLSMLSLCFLADRTQELRKIFYPSSTPRPLKPTERRGAGLKPSCEASAPNLFSLRVFTSQNITSVSGLPSGHFLAEHVRKPPLYPSELRGQPQPLQEVADASC